MSIRFSIVELFNFIMRVSCHAKKYGGDKFDGKQFWKKIKDKLEAYDTETISKWNKIEDICDDYQNVMTLTEYRISGNGNKKIDEINHFIIQTVRIPLEEEANLRKIMQIALNIGFYLAMTKRHEEWMCIHKYLSSEELNNLEKKNSKQLM